MSLPESSRDIRGNIRKSRWLYFALATANFAAVGASLWRGHSLRKMYDETLVAAELWNSRLRDLDGLQIRASELNTPGNNVFNSGDASAELARLEASQVEFDEVYARVVGSLRGVPGEEGLKLTSLLEQSAHHLEGMVARSRVVLDHYVRGEQRQAAYAMALMDQDHIAALKTLLAAKREVRAFQGAAFAQQRDFVAELHFFEVALAGLMALLIVGLASYGFFTSKFFASTLDAHAFLEQQTRALNATAIVSTTDLQGNITFANDKFVEISGYAREELVGRNHRILKSGHHPPDFYRSLWTTISGGHVWKGEVCNIQKDGSRYWVDSTIVPMRDSKGALQHYTSIRFDITRRKNLEAIASAHQREQDQFFELSRDFLCILDADGRFKRISGSFGRVLGYSNGELQSKLAVAYVHPDDVRATLRAVSRIKAGHAINSFSTRYRTRAGTYIHLAWAGSATSEGKLFLIGRDVTEQVAMERALRSARDEAEAASQAKARFLANMSHEIRTPMNGIIGMASVLLDSATDARQIEQLRIIQNCGNSLLDVINDVLDFSKLEAGKISLERKPFDLHSVARDTVALLKIRASEKGLALAYEPEAEGPLWIQGDSTRFRQVLMNLVGNAVKFTERGSVTISSRSRPVGAKQCEFKFSVRDTGIGIPSELQGKLFASFSQVDASTTRRFGGTGLGLAISKGLCENMGGSMWVESQLGKGSTFYFTLLADLIEAAVVPQAAPTVALGFDLALGQRHPLRILVAEDNPMNQVVVTQLLQKFGYQADIAENGLEVLAALRRQNYDLVLMDLHMPELDGLQTTQEIHRQWSEGERPRIMALTASTMQEDIDRCRACGVDGLLAKPLTPPALAAVLAETPAKTYALKRAA